LNFCKNCLKLIDEIHRTRRSIIITRNGVPLVRVIPAGPKPVPKPPVKKPSSKTARNPYQTQQAKSRSLDSPAAGSLGMTALKVDEPKKKKKRN